jgi:hypothetical protein
VRSGAAFTALLAGATVGLLALATGLSPLGRLAPLWVLVPTSLLAAAQVVRDLRAGPAADPEGPAAIEIRRRQIRITAWLVGLAAAVFVVGFFPSAAAFLFLFLRLEARTRPGRALATAAGTVGLLYLLFAVVGGLALPEGLLF